MAGYRLTIDEQTLGLINETCTREAAQKVAAEARKIVDTEDRYWSGDLYRSIRSIRVSGPPGRNTQSIYEVGSHLDYARYQHEGTGIYGPRRRPIRPVRARRLHFFSRTHGEVFTMSVKGVRGIFFLTRAAMRVRQQNS